MTAYANLAITSALTVDGLKSQMDLAPGQLPALNNFIDYITGLAGGNQQASLVFNVGRIQATGTFLLDTVIATDAVSINGVAFTAVNSGAGANQFNVGVSDAATATNLAASINASVTALVTGVVTASASAETVTVTAVSPGTSGNLITISSADATITASGARLTGGLNGTVTTIDLS